MCNKVEEDSKTQRRLEEHEVQHPVGQTKKQAHPIPSSAHPSEDRDQPKLWWIHGKGYNLQEFVDRHPGGREAILLGKGRDCTALVESYHPFSSAPVKQVLIKYHVPGAAPSDPSSSPQQQKPDVFYEVLKQRVAIRLKEKGIDPIQDRGAGLLRSVYYILVMAAWLGSGYLHVTGSISGSFWFAVFGWLMGALGHDAGHHAASRNPWVNEWGVWAMSLICNPILWQHQHTYGHHSFTNEFDRDPDLHHFDTLLRIHRQIKYKTHYQFQSNSLYVVFAYVWVV